QSFQVDRLGIAFVHDEPSSVSPPVCSQMRIIINSEHMSSPGNPPAASLRPPLGKGVKSAPKSGLERGEERAKGGENSCSPLPSRERGWGRGLQAHEVVRETASAGTCACFAAGFRPNSGRSQLTLRTTNS